MKLAEYLELRNETQTSFSRRSGVPQQTISLICKGQGTRVETAAKIVEASREQPAPDGGTVRFEDLIPAAAGDAA